MYDLIDQACAEVLNVSVSDYITVIEGCDEELREEIIIDLFDSNPDIVNSAINKFKILMQESKDLTK
jgi:hypothetical protein